MIYFWIYVTFIKYKRQANLSNIGFIIILEISWNFVFEQSVRHIARNYNDNVWRIGFTFPDNVGSIFSLKELWTNNAFGVQTP